MAPCPECGYDNLPDARACNLCGKPIRSTPQAGPNSADSNDVYPVPTALYAATGKEIPADDDPQVAATRRSGERLDLNPLLKMAGALLLIVVAVGLLFIARSAYSPEKIDALYAQYAEKATSTEFPPTFSEFGTPREESKQYLFQIALAYEHTFLGRNPYEELYDATEARRTEVKAGRPDPGLTASQPDNQDTLERIDRTQAVAGGLYGVGDKPFNSLRSLAGNNERGREQRQLEAELVHGERETALLLIDAQRTQAIGRLDQLRKKTREELRFFIDNGSPKLRSIAIHLHKRLMPEEPLPDSAL